MSPRLSSALVARLALAEGVVLRRQRQQDTEAGGWSVVRESIRPAVLPHTHTVHAVSDLAVGGVGSTRGTGPPVSTTPCAAPTTVRLFFSRAQSALSVDSVLWAGASWSAPVNLDGNGRAHGCVQYPKGWGDEVSATEILGGPRREQPRSTASLLADSSGSPCCGVGGDIVAYVRPEYEPLVWETRSTDGGTNWTPMSRGAFIMVRPVPALGLQCFWSVVNLAVWHEQEAMGATCVSTRSGVLLVAGRFPGITVQASWDGGMTFSAWTVDVSSIWGNGAACAPSQPRLPLPPVTPDRHTPCGP